MRLQAVTLLGFKSFADRTELKILPGITAIVGPNGCGKSNIADAIRWALGEQSPKALRGHRMDDVIFHGSGSRRPLGLAEVLLTFSNDGEVAVPWSEVSVGRRLYRDGESEYLLNRGVCRLKDVHDLFLGTGVNPKAYALMEQERLAHLLTAKPLDRRVFIEEAAGITRYKLQRAETLGKLQAARQNLLRVKDVIDEVRRQLASLERQAKKARAYKELMTERRALELGLLAAQHAALAAEEAGLAAQEAAGRDRVEARHARVAALGGGLELARAEQFAAEHRAGDLRQALQRAELELEGCVARAGELGRLETELAAEAARWAEEAETLRRRLASLAVERETKATLVDRLGDELAALRERAGAEAAALEAARHGLRAARAGVEALRREQVALAGRRTEIRQTLGGLTERGEQLRRRRERLAGEEAGAEEAGRQLDAGRAEVELRIRDAAARAVALGAALSRLGARAETVAGDRRAALEEAERCRIALAARRSSLQALEELETQRAGYGRGVQSVFNASRAAELTGVMGTVADLLEVPPDLERAVEAALGERLQWVVVDTFEAAKRAVGYLGSHDGGQATFLPLDWLNGGSKAHLPSTDGVVGGAADLVGSGCPGLVANVLGSVVVVRDLAAAERLWSANGADTSFVTVEGEILSPPGALGGGRPGGVRDASLLSRKRTIRDLTGEAAGLEARLASTLARSNEAEGELAGLEAERRQAAADREAAEAARLTAAKDLEQVAREQERVTVLRGACRAERMQIEEELSTAESAIAHARDELAGVESDSARTAEAITAELAAIETAAAAETTRAQAFLDAQVELAALAGRIEGARGDVERCRSAEVEARDRIATGEERLVGLTARAADSRREHARLTARAAEVRTERDRAEAAARQAGELLAGASERVRQVGEVLREAESALAAATRQAHELAVQLAEIRVRREDLVHEARRQHEVTVDGLAAAHEPTRDLDATRARLQAVVARIAELSPVNLVADDEYRELDERLTFLRTQHDDLTASMRDLDRALRGMTRTAQARFAEAFEAINRNFQELFARLFEGGRAELRLVEAPEDGDPLETGIEMVAQPRGKRLQAISLLSGGEKALTGLALLFAIFYYRPSPFCLLDEVDAPLDDANIHRFARVLRELAGHTQFVVITHNRKTMEAADVLYGITMEEPGLSRVVSVNLA